MRGGRNKFGPMYKRDRALKQQKKALIRANGLKLEAMTQVMQTVPADLTITSAIQNIHSASKGLPLSHHHHHHHHLHHHHSSSSAGLPPADFDRSPFVTSPVSMAMPPHAGGLQGYQAYGHFQSRTIKSEYPDPYTSSPESLMGYPVHRSLCGWIAAHLPSPSGRAAQVRAGRAPGANEDPSVPPAGAGQPRQARETQHFWPHVQDGRPDTVLHCRMGQEQHILPGTEGT